MDGQSPGGTRPDAAWPLCCKSPLPKSLLHSCCPGEGSTAQENLRPSCCPAEGSTARDVKPGLWLCQGRASLEGGPSVAPARVALVLDGPELPASGGAVCPEPWRLSAGLDPMTPRGGQFPLSAAAHLHLLGESLSLIGGHLQQTEKAVCAWSSLSLLLDSLLCALAPLTRLSAQIPELTGCTETALASALENISYLMPGM